MSKDTPQQVSLKDKLTCFYCKVVLRKKIVPQMFPAGACPPDGKILKQAIEATEKRIEEIITSTPNICLRSLQNRIPDANFLKVILMAEYLFTNSVQGQKAIMHNLMGVLESEKTILKECLNTYGITDPAQLIQYKGVIDRHYTEKKEDSIYSALVECLTH